MNRSILLNLLVIAVVVAFAAIVAVPAQETLSEYGDPRDPDVLERLIEDARSDFDLIDVRTGAEFSDGHIPTALNIDYRLIGDQRAEGDRTHPVVVYCRTGNRSAQAARTLREMGYTQVYDFGGIHRWSGTLEQ